MAVAGDKNLTKKLLLQKFDIAFKISYHSIKKKKWNFRQILLMSLHWVLDVADKIFQINNVSLYLFVRSENDGSTFSILPVSILI